MSVTAFFAFSCFLMVAHATVEVKLGMLNGNSNTSSIIRKFYLFPAAQIALETVAKNLQAGDYKNFHMSFVKSDSCCTRPVRSTGAIASSFHHDYSVNAFLGPPVSTDMIPVADMAAYWNLPVVSGVSTSTLLDDKTRFATLTRAGSCLKLVAQFTSAILQHFRLQQCAILRGLPDQSEYYSDTLPDAVYKTLEAKGVTVIEIFANKIDCLDAALRKAASAAKTVFISASLVRDVMVHAHRLGYTKGSHVFLYWYPFEDPSCQTSSQFEDLDQEAIRALEALLILRSQVPDTAEYHEFQDKLRARQLALYGREGSGENLFAAATHDAVLMYAQVINETVAEGGDVRDGRAITQKMWNRTFQGVTGPFRIGETGDRQSVGELLDMTDTEKGLFSVIGTFDGCSSSLNVDNLPLGAAPRAVHAIKSPVERRRLETGNPENL